MKMAVMGRNMKKYEEIRNSFLWIFVSLVGINIEYIIIIIIIIIIIATKHSIRKRQYYTILWSSVTKYADIFGVDHCWIMP
jgi:hypothetical protein